MTNNLTLPDIADAAACTHWLEACPAHAPTPLVSLPTLASQLGWGTLHAKDETGRMGLGSFKALGGAYAVLCIVRERLAKSLGAEPSLDDIRNAKGSAAVQGLTVCCASAGNHGLSVAAGARLFGAQCEVFLADSVPESFAQRLESKGATVVRAGEVYEDAMAAAVQRSLADDVVLVSDASWEGEMHVPSLVMQGYAAMAAEIQDTLTQNSAWPTHVALQAGVGGIAATVTAHIRRYWPVQPIIVIVEPDQAACLKMSVEAGHFSRASGGVSNMGRLDCKEPSLRAFDVLKDAADVFITVTDEQALAASSLLAESGLQTTPSGAAGLAGMKTLELGSEHRVLILVTEGNVA